MMKTNLAALAGTLALTLLISTVWGAPPPGGGGGPDIGTPEPSDVGNGTILVRGISYKDLIDPVDNDGTLMSCDFRGLPGREITDVFDQLQPGSPDDPEIPPSGIPLSESNQMSFFIPDPNGGDPFEVIVQITVGSKNIFSFNVIGGGIHAINWKAGQYETLIDYGVVDTLDDEDMIVEGMVFLDSNLNKRLDGKSQEVSHLDFCLSAQILPPNTEFFGNCLEPELGIPGGGPSLGGCFPAGPSQQVEFPFAISGTEFENETVTQKLVPALPGAQTDACGGIPDAITGVRPFPFVAKDPRVDDFGNLSGPARTQDLAALFDLTAVPTDDPDLFPDPPTGYPDGFEGVSLDAHFVGTPCLAMIFSNNSKEFDELTGIDWSATSPDAIALPTGPTVTITQFAEQVPGMFPGGVRLTAPLCEANESPGTDNCTHDLQLVEQAALSTNIAGFLLEIHGTAFTNDVFNGVRIKSKTGTFHHINTREACVSLGALPAVLTPEYLAAVIQCKIDLAVGYFNTLETAINAANARGNLLSPAVSRLLRDHSRALSMFNTRHWDFAIDRLLDLRQKVIDGTWNIDEYNDQGNMIMRIDNLVWRAEQLQIADAYLGSL
jgi:hypothetical protein